MESRRNLDVVWLPVADLTPYENNSRTHSPEQVDLLAASIVEYGWTNPVLIDEHKGVVAGHGRLMAAIQLGHTEVPCITLSDLTSAQRRAYVIADNKLAERAGWDDELLSMELAELAADGFDLALTGFDELELGGLLGGTEGLTDPNDAPEPPANPITVAGDLWACGRHRVLCGDATLATDVARLLAGVTPLLMVTDPPYGVEYDADWRNHAYRSDGTPIGASAKGAVSNDDNADWREAWGLFPGDVVYQWHAGVHATDSMAALQATGFEVRAQIIWAKNNIVIGRGHYHVKHEPCWYAVRKGKTGHWSGSRKESTVWNIDKPLKSETGHSTQKPVECMRRPIVNNSAPGQPVYDPFIGSGTTMIAAEMEGRACLGLEIAPAYCDVIVRRWQDFTGETATLESDGRTFDEIAQDRAGEAA